MEYFILFQGSGVPVTNVSAGKKKQQHIVNIVYCVEWLTAMESLRNLPTHLTRQVLLLMLMLIQTQQGSIMRGKHNLIIILLLFFEFRGRFVDCSL